MKKRPVFYAANPDAKRMIWDLEPNEVFSQGYHIYYKLDVSNFNFEKIDARRALFDTARMQKMLDLHKIKIPAADFIALLNFQDYIHMMWPNHTKNKLLRREIFKASYRGKNNPMWLSDAFNKQIAGCLECCLLAQLYLQHCGFESKICFGNAFFEQNPDPDVGGASHAYIVIKLNGQEYIYDPANPMRDAKDKPIIPRVMDYSMVPFKARRAFKDLLCMSVADGGGFAYVEASDIYGCGSCWLYGFESDDVSRHILRRRTEQGIKRQRLDPPQPIHQLGERKI